MLGAHRGSKSYLPTHKDIWLSLFHIPGASHILVSGPSDKCFESQEMVHDSPTKVGYLEHFDGWIIPFFGICKGGHSVAKIQ